MFKCDYSDFPPMPGVKRGLVHTWKMLSWTGLEILKFGLDTTNFLDWTEAIKDPNITGGTLHVEFMPLAKTSQRLVFQWKGKIRTEKWLGEKPWDPRDELFQNEDTFSLVFGDPSNTLCIESLWFYKDFSHGPRPTFGVELKMRCLDFESPTGYFYLEGTDGLWVYMK